MLTLFTCPKPFQGHIDIIQRNAINSWKLLKPKPEIVLLGQDAGVKDICQEYDLIHAPEVDKNEYGTPLVNSIFKIGQASAGNPIVCYINADIILMSDFMPAIKAVSDQMANFVIIGQRWDVAIDNLLDFDKGDWEVDLLTLVAKTGVLHPPSGIDYFAFSRGAYAEIPPFAIGRLGWDNWMVWKAKVNKIPVVDVSNAVKIVHQNHENMKGAGRRENNHWVEIGFESKQNLLMAPNEKGRLNIWASDWILDRKGSIRHRPLTLSKKYIKYQSEWVLPMKWPWWGKLFNPKKSVKK